VEVLVTGRRDEAVTFAIRVTPGASRDEITGVEEGVLRVRLRAKAVEGQANEALVRFLAERLGVSRRNVILLRGHTARRKVVAVSGIDPERATGLSTRSA
jgi:hypothetical protein